MTIINNTFVRNYFFNLSASLLKIFCIKTNYYKTIFNDYNKPQKKDLTD